jgi:ATP:ADP antiporter, AAA family
VSAFASLATLLTGSSVTQTERRHLLVGFVCAFTMFAGYTMLRPVREAMGVTSGVRSLPALFWAVFLVMLVMQPLYGWVMGRFKRSIVLPGVYVFIALTLVAFYVWFNLQADQTWIARSYFVWVSVFNLFAVSVFWSLMVDIFTREQAARLFGFLSAGISTGGLTGPLLASWLAEPIGTINLLLVAAGLFCAAAVCLAVLSRQVVEAPDTTVDRQRTPADEAPVVGAWAAFIQMKRSRYLMTIAAFLLLATFINTVLYIELQRAVADSFSSRDQQTTFFARIDVFVQGGALLTQLLLFPRLLRWLGFSKSLSLVPMLMAISLTVVAFAPVLMVIAVVSVARRVGEFGVTRPCREMLYTVVPRSEKYLAKSLIDTFVFRGGDAISASLLAGITALAVGTVVAGSATAIVGAIACVFWVALAIVLAKRFMVMQPIDTSSAAETTADARLSVPRD